MGGNSKNSNPKFTRERQIFHYTFLFDAYDKLWGVMKEKGVSTYLLREKCGIDSKTIRRLRANDNMETKTLNKLCAVLDCRLEDIAEYLPDEQ
ncbi:helix-turn-helix transcriptional regulator [Enterocloster clostridioformis]|uniref:helix-turn-helix domain-containing protein n=1 Tax=Enterocloster clostridioformis TaxID=1531 RepID=UPI00298CC7C9|nr:helix-turn-helix transcriptional regulator [Enterocloster clostridioformis]